MRRILTWICAGFFVLGTGTLPAQDTLTRPKIGLALSGGASRGIAHLGVIKMMEEAGLRPDYITGVSMGSIVGAMYSLGYSTDSLITILKQTDWDLLVNNRITEDKIIFEEKRRYHNSIFSLPVTAEKVQLPSGIINGQQIENLLSYYFWPAAEIEDFSEFPIPFSCMASDLLTGTKREIKSGYLPDAVRASIAVPTVFTPVKRDSDLLVDGGLLRNIAPGELKAMGADIIIGSYTSFHMQNEEELATAPGIIKQIGFLQSYSDFEKEKEHIDYLIEPTLKEFPSFVFRDIDTLIARGYEAALPFREKFMRLADSLNHIAPQEPVKGILDKQYHTFDRIEVEGNRITTDEQITGILGIEPGKPVGKEEIKEGIDLLYGKVWFEKVNYHIVPRNDSLILIIDCIEKPGIMLYGAMHYDNAVKAGIILNLTSRNLITRRSAINLDTYIAEQFRYNALLTQFVGRYQKFGLSISLSGDNTYFPWLEIRGEGGRVRSTNFYNQLAISNRLGLNHFMNLSAGIDNLYLFPDYSNEDNLQKLQYNYLSGSFEYLANTLNTKHFPDRGIAYRLSGEMKKLVSGSITIGDQTTIFTEESPGVDFSFDRIYTAIGDIRYYFSAGSKATFSLRGCALLTSGNDSITANNNFYLLGGIESYGRRSIAAAGFHPYEIPVNDLAGFGFEADIEFLKDLHLTLTANGFALREPERTSGASLLGGYGIGIGYMTVIGPMKAGFMHGFYGEETHFNKVKGYISIGFCF